MHSVADHPQSDGPHQEPLRNDSRASVATPLEELGGEPLEGSGFEREDPDGQFEGRPL
jgi:hypothetical protein